MCKYKEVELNNASRSTNSYTSNNFIMTLHDHFPSMELYHDYLQNKAFQCTCLGSFMELVWFYRPHRFLLQTQGGTHTPEHYPTEVQSAFQMMS